MDHLFFKTNNPLVLPLIILIMWLWYFFNYKLFGVMVNETASEYYQYSDNLIKLILTLATALRTVMLLHVANAFSHGDMNHVNQMLYKSFDFISSLTYPMMFGIAAISLTLAPKYYGPGYEPVGQAMMIDNDWLE